MFSKRINGAGLWACSRTLGACFLRLMLSVLTVAVLAVRLAVWLTALCLVLVAAILLLAGFLTDYDIYCPESDLDFSEVEISPTTGDLSSAATSGSYAQIKTTCW
jgi:hypothetical protein